VSDFDFLKDYKPEKVADNFEPFKGNFLCVVNSARVEEYDGDNEDFKGHKFFRYELEVGAEQPNAGRRLWKSVDLMDEKADKKGKTKAMKLADAFFTLGLDITKPEDIETFCDMTLMVNCWVWTIQEGESKGEKVQMHSMKPSTSGSASRTIKEEIPF